jgi:hypothetical protein
MKTVVLVNCAVILDKRVRGSLDAGVRVHLTQSGDTEKGVRHVLHLRSTHLLSLRLLRHCQALARGLA